VSSWLHVTVSYVTKRVGTLAACTLGLAAIGRTQSAPPRAALSDFFKPGVVLQDRNNDGVVDFVNARLALAERPSAAETAAAADPLAGDWSCEDALTGHTSRYSFQNNGVLSIATSDGQLLDFKYERELRTLKLTDATAARAFAIEELTTRKMILNLGAGGQRVVCKR